VNRDLPLCTYISARSTVKHVEECLAHPWAPSCFASRIASSRATMVALLTFDSMSARLVGILLPLLSSLILAKTNGVLSLPEMFAALACRRASSIIVSISSLGIANSDGTGLVNSRPDVIWSACCASRIISLTFHRENLKTFLTNNCSSLNLVGYSGRALYPTVS